MTMGWVAAASAVASVAGAAIASNGAKKAASTQADAARDAAALQDAQYQQTREDQLAQYNQVRADQQPYRDVGYSALDNLRIGMGLSATNGNGSTISNPLPMSPPGMGLPATLQSIASNPARIAGSMADAFLPGRGSSQQLTPEQLRNQLLPQFTGSGAIPQSYISWAQEHPHEGAAGYAQYKNSMQGAVDETGLQAAINQAMSQQPQQSGQSPQQIAEQNKSDAENPNFGSLSKRFTLQDYQADPGYQFRVQQGEQGINRAASARGGQYSGATLKALARFNQDSASQEYGNAYSRFNTDQTTQFNRNAALAGIGQTANTATGNAGNAAYSTIANVGANSANQQGAAIQNAGEARASGYVGTANAIGSGIKQIYNNYQQNQAINSANNNNNYNSWTASNSGSGLSNSDLQSAF